MESGVILAWAVDFGFFCLVAAFVLSFIRLLLGPSAADRVVALDLMTILAVGFCALVAISSDRPAFLDVGVALAPVAFLATVVLARYIERRVGPDPSAAESSSSGDEAKP